MAVQEHAPGRDGLGEGVRARTEYDSEGRPKRSFRADIQGLRAVAVLLVVVYHCGVSVVSGGYVGVDVFFVISGFLITTHLIGEMESTGRISIAAFYARRIRRLLPAALLVVATTVVVARVWGPALQSSSTARDGLFSAFYAMNYHLAGQGIDYQQAEAAPSPLQHFWSLAVEEQYYVLWPVALLLVAVLTRRWGRSARRGALVVLLGGIIAVSLSWSISITATNAPLGYYSLQTRGWELAVGALVAVLAPWLGRAPRVPAAVLTWIGMGAVIGSALLLDDTTPFPGSAALWPVVGAALVIGGGVVGSSLGVERVLRGRVTQMIGHVSYGWYLWHWPAIILGPAVFGVDFGVAEKLEISVIALWLAILTYLVVEQPTLRLRIDLRRWFAVGATMSAAVAMVVAAALVDQPRLTTTSAVAASLDLSNPASARLEDALTVATTGDEVPANLTPALLDAAEDQPRTTADGCHLNFLEVEQPDCVFGDPDADRTMLLFGDSHAQQWFGALDEIGRRDGWRVVSWTKAACPVADTVLFNENLDRTYGECGTWREDRLDAIASLKPDLIVASQADTLPGPNYADSDWAAQTEVTMSRLSRQTDRLVFLPDTARPTVDVPSCLADHPREATRCAVPATASVPDGSAFGYLEGRRSSAIAASEDAGATVLDPQTWTCLDGSCPAVVADVLVYRDDSHITDTFSRRLSPIIGQDLDDVPASSKGASS